MANDSITITVDGKDYAIDDFEGRELVDAERQFGVSLFAELERGSATGIYAVLYLIKRRENPAFTAEQALALNLGQVQHMIGGDESNGNGNGAAVPPPAAAGKRKAKTG